MPVGGLQTQAQTALTLPDMAVVLRELRAVLEGFLPF